MNTTRQSRTWPYDLLKAIIALILLGLMLYFRPDVRAMIQKQLGLPFGTVTLLDAPQVAAGSRTTLSGRTQSGATVEVFAGEAKLGTTTAGPDGTWALPVTLPAGNYQLLVQARDAAGADLGAPAVLDWQSQQQAAAPGDAQASAASTQATASGTDAAKVSTDASTNANTESSANAAVEAGTTEASTTEAANASGETAAAGNGSTTPSLEAPQVSVDSVTLAGKGQPGTTIEVVSSDGDVGTAIVGQDGVWTLSAPLAPGDYELQARTIDASGAQVGASPVLRLTVPAAGAAAAGAADAVAPDASIAESAQASVATANVTGDTANFSGAGSPGSTVEVAAGELVLGKVVVGPDGLWKLTAKITPGEYQIIVRTLDASGAAIDESPGVPLSVAATGTPEAETATTGAATVGATAGATKDAASTAPQMAAPVLSGGKAMLSGTAAPGATLEIVANGKVLGQAVADADGQWAVAAQLKPGFYALQIRSRDAAGAPVKLSPLVALTIPAGSNPAVAAGGAVTATAPAELAAAGALTASTAGTTASTAITTSATETATSAAAITTTKLTTNTMTNIAASAVGATSSTTATVPTAVATKPAALASAAAAIMPTAVSAADATAPATAAAKPGSAGAIPVMEQPAVEGDTATFTGQGAPGSTIEVMSGSSSLGKAVVTETGIWSLVSRLRPGINALQARTLDTVGKQVAASRVVTVTVPATGSAVASVATTVALTTATPTATTAAITASAATTPKATAAVTGTAAATAEGATAPAISAPAANAPPTLSQPTVSGNTITLRGAGEPGSVLEIVQDGAVVGTVNVQDDSTWSYSIPAAQAGATAVAAQLRNQPESRTKPVIVLVPVVVTAAPPTSTPGAAPVEPSEEMTVTSAAVTADTSDSSGGQAYIVQSGDSLTALAQEYLGDQARYTEIVAATNEKAKQDPSFKPITDPNLITVGQKFWIPAQ